MMFGHCCSEVSVVVVRVMSDALVAGTVFFFVWRSSMHSHLGNFLRV